MGKYQKDFTSPQISLESSSNKSGFTLIELLVVIAVIGVLAAGVFALINPFGQTAKARDAGRKAAIAQISRALESYAAVHGQYPIDPSSLPDGAWGWLITGTSGIGQTLINSGDAKTIPKDPNDPSSDAYHNQYNYGDRTFSPGCWPGPGKEIVVWAWLENPTDPQISHRDPFNWCNDGSTPITETDGSGKVRGLYMFVSGKKIP